MAELNQWLKDSKLYEFCRSYGIDMQQQEIVDRQEDFYISLLSELHVVLEQYLVTSELNDELKYSLLKIANGLLIYSQKETLDAFHGVRLQNNQLYAASIFYLCDYPTISAWVMKEISQEDYEITSAKLLSFVVTGGAAYFGYPSLQRVSEFRLLETFVLTGDDSLLDTQLALVEKKFSSRDFESPTDFYMTLVLLCVLKKFKQNNLWMSLRGVDDTIDWKDYVRHSYCQHILSFLPSQQDAINKGLLNYEGSFSLKMPTSAGKSYITELLIYHELRSNPKGRVLYLAPLRALSRELKERFRRIHNELGFTYATKYGGSAASIAEENIEDAQLLIATPESFMAIESTDTRLLDTFSLVICDEGQLLDDYTRGINYELLLSRLRRNTNVKFLFISAIIPNIVVVNRWLNGTDNHIGDSAYRPAKLILAEALIQDDRINLHVYNDRCDAIEHTIDSFVTREDARGAIFRSKRINIWKQCPYPVSCTLALKALHAGAVLIFTTAKNTGVSCVGFTRYLIEMLGAKTIDAPIRYIQDVNRLNALVEYAVYQLGYDHLMCQALRSGFAFHHGDVPQNLREKIEQAYNDGLLRLIVSNTTLAEGVNLPIKTIIIAHANDQSNNGMYLPNSRLKNIIGRVGRAGRERYGTIIVPTTYPNNRLIRNIKEALNSNDEAIEPIHGTLYDLINFLSSRKLLENTNDVNQLLSVNAFSDAIDEMILRSSDGNVDKTDAEQLVSNSLAFTLSDNIQKETLRQIFAIRHEELKSKLNDARYQLMSMTGLNLRDLEYVENEGIQAILSSGYNLTHVDDEYFVSAMIDVIMSMPTVSDKNKTETRNYKRLIKNRDHLKIVATLWMRGLQYVEIATQIGISVDDVILIVFYMQGFIHDKAVCIIAYLVEVKGLTNGWTKHWPEYLRLGINTRMMYDLYVSRIPERIQWLAIDAYFNTCKVGYDNLDNLCGNVVEHKDGIYQFMGERGYPTLSTENLMETIDYLKCKQNL